MNESHPLCTQEWANISNILKSFVPWPILTHSCLHHWRPQVPYPAPKLFFFNAFSLHTHYIQILIVAVSQPWSCIVNKELTRKCSKVIHHTLEFQISVGLQTTVILKKNCQSVKRWAVNKTLPKKNSTKRATIINLFISNILFISVSTFQLLNFFCFQTFCWKIWSKSISLSFLITWKK